MKPVRLLTTDKAKLRKASRQAVEDYFISLLPTIDNTGWLHTKNRYKKECINRYREDFKNNTVKNIHLINYISASAPTHAIDGWSLLARATESLLRNDPYSALHLGYYAELRAAMSLLASEGIAVFSTRHPVILPTKTSTASIEKARRWDATTRKYRTKGERVNTHAVIWPMIQHWTQQKRAAELIDQLVRPQEHRLSSWLDRLGATQPVRAIAENWLKTWGMDLPLLDDDHHNRNLASYRPSEFRLPPELMAADAIDFVGDLWSLFEPTAGGRFVNLERLLLRKALRQARQNVTVNELEEKFHINHQLATEWATFLSDPNDPKPIMFAEARSKIDGANCAMEIISRAALLLFLATGATRQILADCGYTSETLSFYWKRHYIARATPRGASLPDDPLDMWSDISASIQDARTWRTQATEGASLSKWRHDQAGVVSQISSLELAGIWGAIP